MFNLWHTIWFPKPSRNGLKHRARIKLCVLLCDPKKCQGKEELPSQNVAPLIAEVGICTMIGVLVTLTMMLCHEHILNLQCSMFLHHLKKITYGLFRKSLIAACEGRRSCNAEKCWIDSLLSQVFKNHRDEEAE